MTQITTLTARLLKAERERDDLVRANFKLRDKLLDLARKCGYCRGAGTIPEKTGPPSPCPVCAHIRKVLD
jgi:rubrerythrin